MEHPHTQVDCLSLPFFSQYKHFFHFVKKLFFGWFNGNHIFSVAPFFLWKVWFVCDPQSLCTACRRFARTHISQNDKAVIAVFVGIIGHRFELCPSASSTTCLCFSTFFPLFQRVFIWFGVKMDRSEERRVGKECRSRW